MTQGKLKKFFPGGNTSQGFYSYYDNIITPDATRIFCIKGGPGVGKSTLMRSIGETMLAKGYDVEYHCCSSDNGSLDGVCIPSIGVALLDGTAPHVVDPKNPGAVDEIVNLGEFWNEEILRKNKEAVLKTNRRVSRLFGMAYFSLKQSKAFQEELESYISESMNWTQVNKIATLISNDLFGGVTPDFTRPAKFRHLFASAITPDGSMNYHDTILHDVEKLFVITGQPGSGKATLLQGIFAQARMLCLDSELYHCSFVPQNIDVIIIPSLKAAVANISSPVSFDTGSLPNLKQIDTFDMSEYMNHETLEVYAQEIALCEKGFDTAFNRAVGFLKQAKAEHDILESYFAPAMNFDSINAKKEEILSRVLKYAGE